MDKHFPKGQIGDSSGFVDSVVWTLSYYTQFCRYGAKAAIGDMYTHGQVWVPVTLEVQSSLLTCLLKDHPGCSVGLVKI